MKETIDGLGIEYKGVIIPKSLIEDFQKLGLNSYDFAKLAEYNWLTKTYSKIETFHPRDLIGVDLSNFEVRVFLSNWEDSEWIYSSGVSSVRESKWGLEFVAKPEISRILDTMDAEDDGAYDEAVKAALAAGMDDDTHIFNINLDLVTVDVLTRRVK